MREAGFEIKDRIMQETATTGPIEPGHSTWKDLTAQLDRTSGLIAWSTFAFAILQSVCTFFTALDGLRLIIGVGALAAITQAGATWDHFHTDWLRVPMILFAAAGSLLNLAILRRIHRLRNRPASKWRQQPPTPGKRRMEHLQLTLSIATLALIAMEEITHLRTFHHF